MLTSNSWRDYLKINPNEYVFDYFDDILYKFANNQRQTINEFNFAGGRNGMKTYGIINQLCLRLMVIAIKQQKKFCFYGFREQGGNKLIDLRDEIQQGMDRIGLKQSINKSRIVDGDYIYNEKNGVPTWKFNYGSFITLRGIRQASGRTIALKGLASCDNADLAISFCEEANEFNFQEFNAIDFAIRGFKQIIRMKASNPDSEYQYYINYCMNRVPFNVDLLETKGQQFQIINENGANKLFHYTNYQVNPYLPEDIVRTFLELKEIDYQQYTIWGLGLPGKVREAIFARYLDKLRLGKAFVPAFYTAGLDIGQADSPDGHPTFACLTGISNNYETKAVAEFYHSNATQDFLDPNQLAFKVVEFFVKEGSNLEKIRKYGLTVWTDYGNGGLVFINLLSDIQRKYFPFSTEWLDFKPVKKDTWFVKDRIDLMVAMMLGGVFYLDEGLTPSLKESLRKMRYKKALNDRANHKIEIIDLDDDGFDAFWYSIAKYLTQIRQAVRFANPLLLPKGD